MCHHKSQINVNSLYFSHIDFSVQLKWLAEAKLLISLIQNVVGLQNVRESQQIHNHQQRFLGSFVIYYSINWR